MKLQVTLDIDDNFRFLRLLNSGREWFFIHQRRIITQVRQHLFKEQHAKWLYFRRDDCIACRVQSYYLKQLNHLNGTIIETIDVDKHPELARQYNVLSLPTTILVDPQGGVRFINRGLALKDILAQQLNTVMPD